MTKAFFNTSYTLVFLSTTPFDRGVIFNGGYDGGIKDIKKGMDL